MMNFDVESVCILQKMSGNKGDVTSCDFSPRFHLATASGDKKVLLYEWKEGLGYVEVAFSPLLGHKYSVTCVRFSPTSSILASASVDGHVNLWDIDSGNCIQSLVQAGGNGIRCLEFTRDGTLLASAGEGGTFCIWSITPQMIILLRGVNGHDDESIQGISFSPDKQILVSGDVTGTFKIWSLSTIKDEPDPPALVTLRDAHDLGVNYLEFSLEFTSHSAVDDLIEYEYLLASCGNDHTIALWQISTIQEAKGLGLFLPAQTPTLITRLTGHNTAVSQLRISPKGDLLASTSIDKTVRIWQISTGRCLKTLEAHSRYVTSCAFSSDQSLLATGSNDRTVIVWDLTGELSFDSVLDGNTRTSQLFSNAISNSSKENTVMLLHELDKHLSSVNSISFSSLFLVSGGSDHKINIWSWNGLKSMTLLHSIVNAHRYPINQVELCPKSGILASCSLDGTVLIWDPQDGQIKKSGFHVSGAGVRCVRIAPNGLLLAAGGDDDGLYVYRLETCECIASAVGDGEGITGISFTPDSKYLMAGSSDGHSKLYPLVPASSTPVHILENAHDLGISGIDFAETVHAQSVEEGRYEMATCGQDTLVKVWSLKTNDDSVSINLVWTLTGHGGSVTWVRFSPKLAEMIASTSTDKTCRLWDSYSGDCLHVLDNHQKTLTCCAFSPDATLLATGSMDKSVIIWRLPSDLNFRSFSAKKSAEINLSEWTVDMVNRWLESMNLPPCNFTGNSLLETPIEDILVQLNIDDETRKELFVLQLNELTLKSIREPPHEFLCPITHHIMRDPVVASDGHSYERNAIESWFAAGHSTSPMTNTLMESQDLHPNVPLKENIVIFLLGN